MRVTYALRADARSKPGGDTKKVDHYRDDLRALGWDSNVVYHPAELEKSAGDIVHVLNLDLPVENLAYVNHAKKLRIPAALSTIRHPWEGCEKMYKTNDDTFFRKLRSVGFTADKAWVAREYLKLAQRRQLRNVPRTVGFRDHQQALMDSVAAYFPMAAGEEEAIKQDFRNASSGRVIPNGTSLLDLDRVRPDRDITFDVVSVGRIEPRKNALGLAKSLARSGLRVAFVGGLNGKHKGYVRDFLDVIESSDTLTHVGALPSEGVVDVLRHSAAYVNAAWFEVVSQADIEAATLGLPVLSTQHSYLDDFLGDGHAIIDPSRMKEADGADYIIQLLTTARPATPATQPSWAESAALLDDAYRDILNNRSF